MKKTALSAAIILSLTGNAFGDDLSKGAVSDISHVKSVQIKKNNHRDNEVSEAVAASLLNPSKENTYKAVLAQNKMIAQSQSLVDHYRTQQDGASDQQLIYEARHNLTYSSLYQFLLAMQTGVPQMEQALYHATVIKELHSINESLQALASQCHSKMP